MLFWGSERENHGDTDYTEGHGENVCKKNHGGAKDTKKLPNAFPKV
jgi:hypothetical protein